MLVRATKPPPVWTCIPSVMKSPCHLEDHVSQEQMDCAWDAWYTKSTTESSKASAYSFPSLGDNPSSARREASIHIKEGKTPTSAQPCTGRRWGFFKKSKPDTPKITVTQPSGGAPRREPTRKRSRTLRKKLPKYKSSPNLKALLPEDLGKVNAYYAPIPTLPPPLPNTPGQDLRNRGAGPPPTMPLPNLPVNTNIEPSSASPTCIYFTVDPNWDPSHGDASLFFIPPSALLSQSEKLLPPSPEISACPSHPSLPRQRALTHVIRRHGYV